MSDTLAYFIIELRNDVTINLFLKYYLAFKASIMHKCQKYLWQHIVISGVPLKFPATLTWRLLCLWKSSYFIKGNCGLNHAIEQSNMSK